MKLRDSNIVNLKELELSDRENRENYVEALLERMKNDIANTSDDFQKQQLNKEYQGRIINVILRGHDIPLQGSSTTTCNHMKRVLPDPSFFERLGYFKVF